MDYPDITLPQHEAHSEMRAKRIEEQINELKGHDMGGGHEKVIINNKYEKEGGGGMDGLAPMAAIAALGQRNEPGGVAALLPALVGMNRHDGLGGLGGAALGFVAGAVLNGNRRGGGLFGGGGDDCGGGGGAETRLQSNADTLAILAATGRVGDAVAATGATNTINLLQQTNEIQQLASANAALITAGTAATERSVTNSATVVAQLVNNVNQNVLEQGCETRAAIAASTTAILSRIDRAEIDQLRHERDRFERGIEINQLRSAQEVSQTVTVTTNQLQAQQQGQAQLQAIINRLDRQDQALAFIHQEARSTNANIIAGNAGPVVTGAQTSTPTQVNAN